MGGRPTGGRLVGSTRGGDGAPRGGDGSCRRWVPPRRRGGSAARGRRRRVAGTAVGGSQRSGNGGHQTRSGVGLVERPQRSMSMEGSVTGAPTQHRKLYPVRSIFRFLSPLYRRRAHLCRGVRSSVYLGIRRFLKYRWSRREYVFASCTSYHNHADADPADANRASDATPQVQSGAVGPGTGEDARTRVGGGRRWDGAQKRGAVVGSPLQLTLPIIPSAATAAEAAALSGGVAGSTPAS